MSTGYFHFFFYFFFFVLMSTGFAYFFIIPLMITIRVFMLCFVFELVQNPCDPRAKNKDKKIKVKN